MRYIYRECKCIMLFIDCDILLYLLFIYLLLLIYIYKAIYTIYPFYIYLHYLCLSKKLFAAVLAFCLSVL